MATAAAGFAILPSATTYTRASWKKVGDLYVPNPEWLNAPYEVAFFIQQDPGNPMGRSPFGYIFERTGEVPKAMSTAGKMIRIQETLPLRYNSPNFGSEPVPPYIQYKKPVKR